jgi:DNA mismatch repair protein MLH1
LFASHVCRYSIYKAGTAGFTLKRQGEARSDLHTLPTASRVDVIRSLFGPDLAASLLPLQLTGGSGDVSAAVPLDGPLGFKVDGFVSNLTHIGRRSTLILFINGRPVDQGQLKRAIEAVYVAQNPKANKPWVFLDLQLPLRHVEVNVHPTKKEVGFLHQQEVIDAICGAVEGLLRASMNSRSFAVNKPSLLAAPSAAAGVGPAGEAPAACDDEQQEQQDTEAAAVRPASGRPGSAAAGAAASQRPPSSSSKSQAAAGTQQQTPQQTQPYYRPEKLVRTDHRSQTIDGFLVSQASAAAVASAAAAAAAAAAPRRRSSAAAGRVSTGSAAAAGEDGDGAVLLSNASLHLQAAAAEEAAAAAEWQQQQGADGDPAQQAQQQQKQMFMLRAARQPKLPAVVTQLSSVRELLDEVAAGVHGELQELFRQHTWVGMVSASSTQCRLEQLLLASVSGMRCVQLQLM